MSKTQKTMKVVDFMQKFDKLNIDKKMETAKKVDEHLKSKKSPSGEPMTEGEIRTLAALSRWCSMNILIGGELCSPTEEALKQHL